MPTATRITDRIPGKAGEAYGYELSEPYNGVDYLIVSRIDMAAFGLRETRILPGQLFDGRVIAQTNVDNTLALSIPLELCSHEEALASIGYEAVEPPPVVEAPPGDPDEKIEPTPEAS
ncbi:MULTISPECIES: hypothetical protein [Nocardiaceae]|uniref:hypothetical protein n=1 Tax=Nocardiaceae TaxID=85025 RepID=UPI0005673441|nr:hypothetical protein [Rhodococcus fascians]